MMTPAEQTQLETLRAEMNGKLDLLIERTVNLKADTQDHEARIRVLEELGSPNARVAVKETEAIEAALEARNELVDAKFREAADKAASTQRKLAYATGIVVGASFLFNIVLPVLHIR